MNENSRYGNRYGEEPISLKDFKWRWPDSPFGDKERRLLYDYAHFARRTQVEENSKAGALVVIPDEEMIERYIANLNVPRSTIKQL